MADAIEIPSLGFEMDTTGTGTEDQTEHKSSNARKAPSRSPNRRSPIREPASVLQTQKQLTKQAVRARVEAEKARLAKIEASLDTGGLDDDQVHIEEAEEMFAAYSAKDSMQYLREQIEQVKSGRYWREVLAEAQLERLPQGFEYGALESLLRVHNTVEGRSPTRTPSPSPGSKTRSAESGGERLDKMPRTTKSEPVAPIMFPPQQPLTLPIPGAGRAAPSEGEQPFGGQAAMQALAAGIDRSRDFEKFARFRFRSQQGQLNNLRENGAPVAMLLRMAECKDIKKFHATLDKVWEHRDLTDHCCMKTKKNAPAKVYLREDDSEFKILDIIKSCSKGEKIIRIQRQDSSSVAIQQKQCNKLKAGLWGKLDTSQLTACNPAPKRVSVGSDSWSLYWQPTDRVLCTMEYNHHEEKQTLSLNKCLFQELGVRSEEVDDIIKDLDALFPITTDWMELPPGLRGKGYRGHISNPLANGDVVKHQQSRAKGRGKGGKNSDSSSGDRQSYVRGSKGGRHGR